MGLDLQQILIGHESTYIDNIFIKNNNFSNKFVADFAFLMVHIMDFIVGSFDSKLESISNIDYISENSFMHYDSIIKNNYKPMNNTWPYGFGSYFHNACNDKFRIVSIDRAIVDANPIFLTNHPINNLLAPFSQNFTYKFCEGVCNFKEFDYLKHLGKISNAQKYSAKIIALNGHVHLNGKEAYLNNGKEFYFENPFFMDNPKQISDLIEAFRVYKKKYKADMKLQFSNNFDYSHLMFSNLGKYYYYAEATVLNAENHHDRLGIITELVPDNDGISGAKVSLVNYFECLNNLKAFAKNVKSGGFNSDKFISEISSKLGVFFK
jgi:hypothetical protein